MKRLLSKIQLAVLGGRSLRHTRKRWFERTAFWGGGLAVGLTAVGMAVGAEKAEWLFHYLSGFSYWITLVLTPAGFAASAWLTRRIFPGAQGSGIPQAIVAQETQSADLRNRLLAIKIALGKILLTLFGMACGGSIGREGPTVQVGASIMNAVGRFWGRQQQALIVAGAAAGVAAAFNTPLGGIVFAIEEMSRSLHKGVNGLILGAVIIAGISALALTGSYTYFGRVDLTLADSSQWIAVPVCGVVCGLIGGLFSLLVAAVSTGQIERFSRDVREHPFRFAAACGLLVSVIGLLTDGATFGTGYEPARRLLEGIDGVSPAYGILKLLATALSAVCGIPGGMFSPSLSVGAGLGANLAEAFPHVPIGTLALLGMVAYFAGVVQAPITSFVIVAEMTGSYSLTVPLMTASWIGYGTARLIRARPIYQALAEPMRRPASVPQPTSAGPIDEDPVAREVETALTPASAPPAPPASAASEAEIQQEAPQSGTTPERAGPEADAAEAGAALRSIPASEPAVPDDRPQQPPLTDGVAPSERRRPADLGSPND